MVIFVICCLLVLSLSEETQATVYFETGKLHLSLGVYDCKNGVACGKFKNEINTDGWDKLFIKTNTKKGSVPVAATYKAAGMIEGALSWDQIWSIYWNHLNHWGWVNSSIPEKVVDFMTKNWDYTKNEANMRKENDDYWKYVANLVAQFEGMFEAYNQHCDKDKQMTEMNLFFLQSAGDLYGVLGKFGMSLPFQGMDCSGMIKLVPSETNEGTFSDVYVGHDTFRSFGIQNKVFKTFTFDDEFSIAFSSSPGFISSKDDYYLTSEGLVVLETTNSVFVKELQERITPYSLFTWIRSPLASRLAKDPAEWGNYFSKYSSATYTNQWMVIDMKKFHPNEKIEDGFFLVLEEIPEYIHDEDMTNKLIEMEYWPSYNIPYFPDVYNKSGYTEMKKEYGDKFDYLKCPRSQIFGKLEGDITSFSDFGYVMQYNQYKTDPMSLDDPNNSIMSRCDLREEKAAAFGGIDGKIVNFEYSKLMKNKIIAGPTHQSDQTPPFEWTDEFETTVHIGQPKVYNFDWLDITVEY